MEEVYCKSGAWERQPSLTHLDTIWYISTALAPQELSQHILKIQPYIGNPVGFLIFRISFQFLVLITVSTLGCWHSSSTMPFRGPLLDSHWIPTVLSLHCCCYQHHSLFTAPHQIRAVLSLHCCSYQHLGLFPATCWTPTVLPLHHHCFTFILLHSRSYVNI